MPPIKRFNSHRIVVMLISLVFMHLVINSALAEQRALIIGNSEYERAADLANPGNDAADVAARLGSLGYRSANGDDLAAHANLTRREMVSVVREFTNSLEPGDLAIFYFAGHGAQSGGENYLIPSNDADIVFTGDLPSFAYALADLLRRLEVREGVTSIIFLDACRNNPLPVQGGNRSPTSGLAFTQPSGSFTYIIYASRKGYTASDGEGDNSPFTAALLQALNNPGRRINDIYYEIRTTVRNQSNGEQIPVAAEDLEEPIYLAPRLRSDDRVRSTLGLEEMVWSAIDALSDPAAKLAALRNYLERFPLGTFAVIADGLIDQLEIDVLELVARRSAQTNRTTAASNSEATFGVINLDGGFMPDPQEFTLLAGGFENASRLGGTCIGYIAAAPDYVLDYAPTYFALYIRGASTADTVLVVQAPDGSWHCNDDYDGLDPGLAFSQPEAGRYRIWLGTFWNSAEFPEATLVISEIEG